MFQIKLRNKNESVKVVIIQVLSSALLAASYASIVRSVIASRVCRAAVVSLLFKSPPICLCL